MSASIVCERLGKLVNMTLCHNCYYKRHDMDVSIVWCKFKIRSAEQNGRRRRVQFADSKLSDLKYRQDRLYATGQTIKAESLSYEITIAKSERRAAIMVNEAIAHITDQAMKENNPHITKIEEYLTAKCTGNAVAEKLLNKEKSLRELYDDIYEKARKSAVKGAAVMTSEEVFEMVDEYYGLNAADEMESAAKTQQSKAVNILDFL